jgi:transcriptional regulator with XRE-family HTH domain
MSAEHLERVRHEVGLSREEFAARAGTSRTRLSAYERGRKSPTLATVERLLDGAGFELTAEPHFTFREVPLRRGRPSFVADRLWRLPIRRAFAEVTLPLGLNWSRPGAVFQLSDRRRRARCYEVILREGTPADILGFVDGRCSSICGRISSCHARSAMPGSPSSTRSSRERPRRVPSGGCSTVVLPPGIGGFAERAPPGFAPPRTSVIVGDPPDATEGSA